MTRLVTAFILAFATFLSLAPMANGQDSEAAASESEIVLSDRTAEAEIPVLTKVSGKPAEKSNPFFRLIVSLVVISVLCIGAIFFTKWWGRNHGAKVDSTRIRVISQHFLGPKKSLAIVRVAGESILIGITEQSISHLRTLSLLDEENEEVDNGTSNRKDFRATLKEKSSFAISNNDEEFAFGQVQDRYTNSGGVKL